MAAAAAAASGQSPAPLAVVNAANYVAQVSPGGLATAFGAGLPADSASSVNVCEPGNPPAVCVPAAVFAASPDRINFLLPEPPPFSQVVVQVAHSGAVVASGSVPVSGLGPAVFTADNSGTGILNGQSWDGGLYSAVHTAASTGSGIAPRAVSPTGGSSPNGRAFG
jgi:uncharacterized protein (TIGR03437 family)